MIKQLIMIFILCFGLTGCSLIPRITTDRPGTTPQSVSKSVKKESCAGKFETNDAGEIISCSKGYHNYENNYAKAERAYTLSEKVGNFIRGLASWGLFGLVLVFLLVPGLFGVVIGRVFNSANSALTQTVSAIKKYRQKVAVEEKERLDSLLRAEQDQGTKVLINKLRTGV